MGWILLWVIFSAVSAQNVPSLNLNAICKDKPEAWRCERLSPTLKEALKRDQNHGYGNEAPEPILCFPSSQAQPTRASDTNMLVPQTQATTSQPSFWWVTTFTDIPEKIPPPGSSWTATSKAYEIEPTTIKISLSHKSKADHMCEIYSQYVYRIEQSPALIGNQDTIKVNECGMRRFVGGGTESKPKEFPHMALIGYDERPNIKWLCGGSLISHKFILSAAHCSDKKRVATWVRLGDLDISTDNDDAEPVEVRIIKMFKHPEYKNKLAYNDLALFELESEVKLGPYIRPLCLQSTKDFYSDTALASGWGKTSFFGKSSERLQKVNVTLVNHKKCNESYNSTDEFLPNGIIDDLMICAGGKEGDTCQGDSGGPLQIVHKDIYCMYSQIGVISFGRGCAFEYPGVYTRVSNYLPWIESVVWP